MQDLLNLSTIFLSLICLIAILFFLGKNIRNNSQLFMPKEYKTIKRIVSKISTKNDLGDYPFIFSGSIKFIKKIMQTIPNLMLCLKN